MKKIFLILISFILHNSFSFGQSWLWGTVGCCGAVKEGASNGALSTDKSGNAYFTGGYLPVVHFGTFILSDSNTRTYTVKCSPSGTVLWAVQSSSPATGTNYGSAMSTDNFNNIYIAGNFTGNLSFGSSNLITSSKNTPFIVKYNTSGNALWARQGTTSASCAVNAHGIATDKNGNIFVAGHFNIGSLTFGSNVLTTPYSYDVFLVKYDSNGNVLWAKQSLCKTINDNGYAYSVATDRMGNAYVTGLFQDSIIFGPYTLATANKAESTIFLAKYDPNGNILWAKQSNGGGTAFSVTTDDAGNSYITGEFADTIFFGSHMLYWPRGNSGLYYQSFLAKYDVNGNVVWAKNSSGGNNWEGSSLSVDNFNHLYMGGWGYSDSTFHFGNLILPSISKHNEYSSFIVKLDTAGNALCGSVLLNLVPSPSCVASDSTGKYTYMLAEYQDSVICGKDTLLGQIGEFPILGRWQECNNIEGISEIKRSNLGTIVFPNPNNGTFTLSLSNVPDGYRDEKCEVEIYNTLGQKVLMETLRAAQGDNLIKLNNEPNGVYFYRVLKEDGTLMGQGKIVVEK